MCHERRFQFHRRFLFLGAITLSLVAITAQAQETKFAHELSIKSDLAMAVAGQNQKVAGDTRIFYTLKRDKNKITLIFDKTDLTVKVDDKVFMNMMMSQKEFVDRSQNKMMTADEAPAELKKMLKDSFNSPIYQFEVDENQKETTGKIVARAGANEMVRNGQIENARLFHQPFLVDRKSWKAPVKLSIGNGNFAKGELNYEKQTAQGDLVPVKVSGKLVPTGKQNGLDLKNGLYEVTGIQNFNTKTKQFETGKLDIDIEFDLFQGEKSIAQTEGKMVVELKKAK